MPLSSQGQLLSFGLWGNPKGMWRKCANDCNEKLTPIGVLFGVVTSRRIALVRGRARCSDRSNTGTEPAFRTWKDGISSALKWSVMPITITALMVVTVTVGGVEKEVGLEAPRSPISQFSKAPSPVRRLRRGQSRAGRSL